MPGRARAHFRAAAGGGASCFFLEEFGCFGDSFSGAFRWRESQSCCYDRASVRTESVPILWEDGNFPGCKSAGVQGGERENRQLRYGRTAENKKRPVEKQVAALFCDADRTQTCNLLIRSQMLYSIKLRCRIANANVGQCWLTDSYGREFCRWFSLFRAVTRRGLNIGLNISGDSFFPKLG